MKTVTITSTNPTETSEIEDIYTYLDLVILETNIRTKHYHYERNRYHTKRS